MSKESAVTRNEKKLRFEKKSLTKIHAASRRVTRLFVKAV